MRLILNKIRMPRTAAARRVPKPSEFTDHNPQSTEPAAEERRRVFVIIIIIILLKSDNMAHNRTDNRLTDRQIQYAMHTI